MRMLQFASRTTRATAAVAAALLVATATLAGAGAARGDTTRSDEPASVLKDVYVIRVENHRFHPEELIVPSGRKVKLRIENLDPTPEEFESYELNREKVVVGGGKITVYIGPLKPGRYPYFGDFNPKTARGVVVAKPLEGE